MFRFCKLRDTLRSNRLNDQIQDKFEFHLEQGAADFMAQGATEAEARGKAARFFGNRASLAASTHEFDALV